MKKIAFFLFIIMLLSAIYGCNSGTSSEVTIDDEQANTPDIDNNAVNNPTVDLVIYLGDDGDEISAHVLLINIADKKIIFLQEEVFKASGETGWLDRIYPLSLSGRSLVLPHTPVEKPMMEYSIATDGEVYFKDYILVYDDEQSIAEISKGDLSVATLLLTLDRTHLVPQAFFIDDENKISVLCNTVGDTFDKVNPMSLVYAVKNGAFELETTNDHASIFDDYQLSKINLPNNTRLETNIHGNAQSKTFLWNEGANIVEINPYDGTVSIVLTVGKIKDDMPSLDTHREFYEFFTGAGYQNGVYIAKFPNYNNLSGTIAVFYCITGEFIGSILCTGKSISLLDKDNNEIDRIENTMLMPLLFIPQNMVFIR
jgi:hypothetical protein